jgi:hypothetical protein
MNVILHSAFGISRTRHKFSRVKLWLSDFRVAQQMTRFDFTNNFIAGVIME